MSPSTAHEHAPCVLLIEDNPGDSRIALELFAQANSAARIVTAHDGMEAMQRLREGPPPDLVLLDLNLPAVDGWEILRTIRADPRLRLTPVIVLTTSRSDTDIRRCYELQANCYLVKPLDLDDFARMIALIDQFWLRTAVLPSRLAARA